MTDTGMLLSPLGFLWERLHDTWVGTMKITFQSVKVATFKKKNQLKMLLRCSSK